MQYKTVADSRVETVRIVRPNPLKGDGTPATVGNNSNGQCNVTRKRCKSAEVLSIC